MIVYRFDRLDAFPLLDSYTTNPQGVTMRVDELGPEKILRVTCQRIRSTENRQEALCDTSHVDGASDRPVKPCVTLALPLRAIDGQPEQLVLEIDGDAGGCNVFLEAADGSGCGLVYHFGTVDFTGRQACAISVQRPCERWSARAPSDAEPVLPPLQFHRLRFELPAGCPGLDLGLVSLSVTGAVQPITPGIA